jgi:hypothetical protein
MADDAEVARLMRAMGGGDVSPRGKVPVSPRGHNDVPISPRGHTTDLEENLEGMSKEEARLLRSMHTGPGKPAAAHHPIATTAPHHPVATTAPAKKWADPVAAKPVPPRTPLLSIFVFVLRLFFFSIYLSSTNACSGERCEGG